MERRRPPASRGARFSLETPDLRPGPLARAARLWLDEDRAFEDVTSDLLLPPRLRAVGTVEAQAVGVLSGLRPALAVAKAAGLRARPLAHDGDRVRPGDRILRLEGPARALLASERTVLNLLMHLSGVATSTAKALTAAGAQGRHRIVVAATRKTLPGLRDLEKAAVVHGGGDPYRRDLASSILVKNNHLALVPLEETLRRIRARAHGGRPVIVEVSNFEDALRAARGGADRLLLDNLRPAQVRALLRRLRSAGLPPSLVIEVSGGIDLRNVRAYAKAGAHVASMGAITHSARALPFHLRVVPARAGRRS